MLDTFMDILAFALKLLTGYTALIGLCFLLPRKKPKPADPKTRFAVLIAARNEENVIGALIGSLKKQEYPDALYDIIVIPNNCTDDTEAAAIRAGAKILHCPQPVKTKGEVLHQILGMLRGSYDAYVVFDADNVADSGFLAAMNSAIAAGAQVAKSRQNALNPYDNWVCGAYDIYFQNINLLHSRARAPFPLSAKLVGTGFMVTDSLLQTLGGWNTVTLTEDIEFAVLCALKDVRVHYVPEALTYDEEPVSFRVSLVQRRRWSAGVQSVANRYIGKLLRRRPSWLRWDLAAHISMIYVQLLALIPGIYELVKVPLPQIGMGFAVALVSFWAGGAVMGLAMCIFAKRSIRKMWKAILLYPLFLASWYPMHIWGLFSKPKTWKPIVHGAASSRKELTKMK